MIPGDPPLPDAATAWWKLNVERYSLEVHMTGASLMFSFKAFWVCGVALLSLLLARPAFAVYTADWKLMTEDQRGNPVPDTKVTFGETADNRVTAGIFNRWQTERDSTLPFLRIIHTICWIPSG